VKGFCSYTATEFTTKGSGVVEPELFYKNYNVKINAFVKKISVVVLYCRRNFQINTPSISGGRGFQSPAPPPAYGPASIILTWNNHGEFQRS